MFKYSKQLRTKIIKYFKTVYKVLLSHEQADQYLDALADFFIAYNKE
ncbi:hypothetical protein KAJ61_05895 [Candidatus Parcubacteria bacterium]|nr:hypothetical protein [Candidatus Parcubacteria bacterium]